MGAMAEPALMVRDASQRDMSSPSVREFSGDDEVDERRPAVSERNLTQHHSDRSLHAKLSCRIVKTACIACGSCLQVAFKGASNCSCHHVRLGDLVHTDGWVRTIGR